MKMNHKRKPDAFVCPHCGADVPTSAPACRECGSDNETGWSEDAHVWEAGIPGGYGNDDDFDYDEFIERDLAQHADEPARRRLAKWGSRVVIVMVCLGVLIYLLAIR
jgi:ribosomal protein L40E